MEEAVMLEGIVLAWLFLVLGSFLFLTQDDTDEGIVIGVVGLAIAFSPFLVAIGIANYIGGLQER
jgi:hypothetical protein